MTNQRRVVLEELRKLRTHPTADELYGLVRARLPRISLGTVYRNLQVLAREGAIRCLSEGSRMRWDGTLHNHYHVRCCVCGRVADVPAQAVRGWSAPVAGPNNFRILGFKMEFLGICPECDSGDKGVDIAEEMQGVYRLDAGSGSGAIVETPPE
ncbi:MAG: transcriptional repressor [Candidatus Glassbacteria bacterium]